MGWCRCCGTTYTIDRQQAPWSRARTCSDTCRAILGNRGRNPLTCDHCAMVETYTHERHRQEIAIENGGWRDETWRQSIITFRAWLEARPIEPTVAA